MYELRTTNRNRSTKLPLFYNRDTHNRHNTTTILPYSFGTTTRPIPTRLKRKSTHQHHRGIKPNQTTSPQSPGKLIPPNHKHLTTKNRTHHSLRRDLQHQNRNSIQQLRKLSPTQNTQQNLYQYTSKRQQRLRPLSKQSKRRKPSHALPSTTTKPR